MDIASLYKIYIENPVVTTDTRNIIPGSIYFALKGDRFDGNTFAVQALEKGARYSIIDNKDYYVDERTILVENTLSALQNLANYHRNQLSILILGITGTNGKTTTKELIKTVLSQKYKVLATQGNLNNHIGVPLTLLSMNTDLQIGIVEMGANHPFEIKQLAEIAQPDLGIITNIGKAHLEGFGGFEGVIKTKKELYDYIEGAGGTVFYNAENPILTGILDKMKVKTIPYGTEAGSYCKGKLVEADPYLNVVIENIAGPGQRSCRIATNLVGSYNFENILAAVAIGLYFHIPLEDICTAIASYVPSNNRSQLTKTSRNELLLDYYNANPSSTEAAILNFSKIKRENKMVILGDMLELGEDSEKEHTKILELLSSFNNIQVFLVGEQYKKIAGPFHFTAFETSKELNEWFSDHPVSGQFILLKGSRGIKLEQVLENL